MQPQQPHVVTNTHTHTHTHTTHQKKHNQNTHSQHALDGLCHAMSTDELATSCSAYSRGRRTTTT